MRALGVVAVSNSFGQFAYFLHQPKKRRLDPSRLILLTVDLHDMPLESSYFHAIFLMV